MGDPSEDGCKADVYHALAYYHDHPEEMEGIERRREGRIADVATEPYVTTGPYGR
jgi:hypothetical protein